MLLVVSMSHVLHHGKHSCDWEVMGGSTGWKASQVARFGCSFFPSSLQSDFLFIRDFMFPFLLIFMICS